MILAIDTSSAISVVVTDADASVALGRASVFDPRGHAERLTPLIADAMLEAGIGRADVSDVVVGTGPGPFTGLRVGLVTARTLALAWGVPLMGVCSLDAIGALYGDVVAVSDARRREVYWARYADGVRVEGPAVDAPAAVIAEGIQVIGRGAALYPEVFGEVVSADPDPLWLARRALAMRAAGEDTAVTPLYLRRPDVHGQ